VTGRKALIAGREGFTLIEVIVTIIMAAILGAVFLQVMETNVTGSVEPLTGVKDVYALNQVMERVTADYRRLLPEDDTLETLKGLIGVTGTEITDGRYVKYVDEEPVPYTVRYNGYILFTGPDGDGNYTEVADTTEKRLLKVTLSVGSQRLTVLFTE
jgi:prepilin-type N-terminal cleavage/methylation domain-containing protein